MSADCSAGENECSSIHSREQFDAMHSTSVMKRQADSAAASASGLRGCAALRLSLSVTDRTWLRSGYRTVRPGCERSRALKEKRERSR